MIRASSISIQMPMAHDKVPLKDIEVGSYFIHNEVLYQRLEEGGGQMFRVVKVQSGAVDVFGPICPVIPVKSICINVEIG